MYKAVQEVDIVDVIKSVGRRNKKLQAKVLQELENQYGALPENLRKFFLDELNGYTRAIMRDIFGDIEYMIKG